jgi:hypothetical protein
MTLHWLKPLLLGGLFVVTAPVLVVVGLYAFEGIAILIAYLWL